MRRPRARLLYATLAAVTVLVTGCTGVPRESEPQVVATVPVAEQSNVEDLRPPAEDESPRAIVSGFLAANLSSDAEHTVAKSYLTPQARARWSVSTTTVVDGLRTGTLSGDIIDVTSDQRLGTIDANGEYTPDLGSSKRPADKTFAFRLTQNADRQWRISDLPSGLIVDNNALVPSDRRTLYFFDPTSSYLIPDVRYTDIAAQSLSSWLLAQLINGPRSGLADIARTAIPNPDARATLSANGDLTVNIPGASRFDGSQLRDIGAELAFTFESANQAGAIRITDASAAVTLPGGLSTFTTSDFAQFAPNAGVTPTAYYLNRGLLYPGGTEKPVTGPFGNGRNPLTSVAIRQSGDSGLDVAGVRTGSGRLVIGGLTGSVAAIRLPAGARSRPDWSSISRQVWIGVGEQLCAASEGRVQKVALVDPQTPLPLGKFRIRAVRVSPEGSRIALVIAAGGSSTLWVGAINQTAAGVQVEALTPVTPVSQRVVDAGWSDDSTLTYTGSQSTFGVWTVLVDGSDLTELDASALPNAPTSIAVTPGALALVAVVNSAGNSSLWEEPADPTKGWAPLGENSASAGSAPTYAN